MRKDDGKDAFLYILPYIRGTYYHYSCMGKLIL